MTKSGGDTTMLVIRVDEPELLAATMSLMLPAADCAEDILSDRQGEQVVLGLSSEKGVWSCVGVGRLSRIAQRDGMVRIGVGEVSIFAAPATIITDRGGEDSERRMPYALDVVEHEDLASALQDHVGYGQMNTHILAAAESAPIAGLQSPLSIRPAQDTGEAAFFRAVGTAYGWRCAFTGMQQVAPDQASWEGVVIGLESSSYPSGKDASRGLYASASFAWYYRHGFIAIGDDYDIVRNVDLNAKIRTFLDVVNPKALIHLPEDGRLWPDLDAIRRHRLHHGL